MRRPIPCSLLCVGARVSACASVCSRYVRRVRQMEELRVRLAGAHGEVTSLRSQLHELDAKHASVLSLQDEAVKFTLQCLDDVRDRVVPKPQASSYHHRPSSRTSTPPTGAGERSLLAEGGSVEDGGGSVLHEERSLASLDASARHDVMEYLLEQLTAYQHQLQELALHQV